jgi:hypothetical protein
VRETRHSSRFSFRRPQCFTFDVAGQGGFRVAFVGWPEIPPLVFLTRRCAVFFGTPALRAASLTPPFGLPRGLPVARCDAGLLIAGVNKSAVMSKNLKRRHLDESQRAMVAAKLANMSVGRPPETAPIGAISDGAADCSAKRR